MFFTFLSKKGLTPMIWNGGAFVCVMLDADGHAMCNIAL